VSINLKKGFIAFLQAFLLKKPTN